jgi:hypothetical protein
MIIFGSWNHAGCSVWPSKGPKDKSPLCLHSASAFGKFSRAFVLLRFSGRSAGGRTRLVLVNKVNRNFLSLLPAPTALRHFPSWSTKTPITKRLQSTPIGRVPRTWLSGILLIPLGKKSRGWGGIRTHGTFRFSGFQDRRIRPLYHPSRLLRLQPS